jgi:hypothetical protein
MKTKRKLELGMPFVGMGNDRVEFFVHPGRWTGGDEPDADCLVIVQERMQGPLGKSSVFKMAIEPWAVETIREGVIRWLHADGLGTLDRLFKEKNTGAI